jgi:hypothetical protein
LGRAAALKTCADKVHGWAKEFHTGVVNFQEEMNDVNAREQAKDPTFTIVGPDRVHPGAVGHFVMAYTFLKAQHLPGVVARIAVNAKTKKADGAVNCIVTNIKPTGNGVEFDALEKALPFVTPSEAKPALALVPFDRELNQEPLVVTGLKSGNYTVTIDGTAVGEYSDAELKSGVDLAQNEKTPQFQQSAQATRVNTERAAAGGALRSVAIQYYSLSRAKVDLADRPAVEKKLTEQFAATTASGKPIDPIAQQLLNDPTTPDRLRAKYDEVSAALLKACQPKMHHFALSRKE